MSPLSTIVVVQSAREDCRFTVALCCVLLLFNTCKFLIALPFTPAERAPPCINSMTTGREMSLSLIVVPIRYYYQTASGTAVTAGNL